MRIRPLYVVSFFTLIAAIILILVAFTGAGTSIVQASPPSQGTPIGQGGPRLAQNPGDPAIVPSLHVTSNGTPAITKSDVIQYINANGYAGGPVVSGGHVVIEKILFISAKQASALIRGESADRPDTTIVCYVQLRGPFIIEALDVPPGVTNQVPPVLRGYEIFDAYTGNQLQWGGLP